MTTLAPSAYERLRLRAAEACERQGVSPIIDHTAARRIVTDLVTEHQRHAATDTTSLLSAPNEMIERLLIAISSYGPLTPLLERDDVEEIFIEGDRVSYIEAGGRMRALAAPTTETENRHIVERLLEGTGRRLDATSAIQQAHVLGGRGRLTAVIGPVSNRLSVTIRMYTARSDTLADLTRRGVWSPAAATYLWCLAQVRSSVLFAGPTGAGKTTALAGFLRAVPTDQCIRIVEEVRELNVPLSLHSSSYEASGVALDGVRRYGLRDLIKVCLAMRVDLLCVGEVRGSEAFELVRAANAGGGFACTIHADSAAKALTALLSAALMAAENVPASSLRSMFSESLDTVIYLDRHITETGGSHRECREIVTVRPVIDGGGWVTEPIFERRSGELVWTGIQPDSDLVARIERILPDGVTVAAVLNGEWSPE